MKHLFLLLIFVSLTAKAAENWFPVGKPNAKTTWMKKAKCETQEGQKCFDITGLDLRKVSVAQVDDPEQPNYRPVNDSPIKIDCASFEDCAQKAINPDNDPDTIENACEADANSSPKWAELSEFTGIDGVTGPWFIWCEKLDGTFKKKEVLAEDAAKAAAADAADAEKAQLQALETEGGKAVSLGLKVKNVMVGMIKLKGLPKAQRKALRGDLKSIIEALEVGSIDIAIDEIKALTEDGVVITPEAKATVLKIFQQAGYDIG